MYQKVQGWQKAPKGGQMLEGKRYLKVQGWQKDPKGWTILSKNSRLAKGT